MANKIKLGDVATYINGYAFKPEDRGSEGFPIIRIQDLTGNAYDLGFYNGKYPEKIEINDGDVLISWSASLGVYVWNRGKALLNQHIFKVVFDKVEINTSYFVYAVKYKLTEMASKTHGATMKHIVKKEFDATEIPYPEMKQQLEIATILDKVSYVIKVREKELEELDTLIKSRFVELFGDPVTNEKNWPRLTLGDICEIGSSKRVFEKDYVSQGIPFFRTKEIVELSKGNSISTELFITEEHFAELKKSYGAPKKDDLLISAVGTIGTIWIISGDFEFYFKDGNLIQVKSSPNFNSIFMKYLLDELIANYKKEMSTGTAYSALTIAGLKKMLVYDVPLVFQEEFATFVEQVDKLKVPEIHLKLTLYYLQYKYKKRRSTDVQF
ncbi:MAG: restriction endonuclease subunit S [Lachnospiraceae bacterium]|nr:restriction endonuclease subunit S [Lachnospiraceae bacterium]